MINNVKFLLYLLVIGILSSCAQTAEQEVSKIIHGRLDYERHQWKTLWAGLRYLCGT